MLVGLCKAPLGKRCWKMYYMVLRDTALYLYTDQLQQQQQQQLQQQLLLQCHHCHHDALHLYTDENCYKRSTLCTNTIQLQHALSTKASDYTKKKHVIRLQTADLAQYLIQTRYWPIYIAAAPPVWPIWPRS